MMNWYFRLYNKYGNHVARSIPIFFPLISVTQTNQHGNREQSKTATPMPHNRVIAARFKDQGWVRFAHYENWKTLLREPTLPQLLKVLELHKDQARSYKTLFSVHGLAVQLSII